MRFILLILTFALFACSADEQSSTDSGCEPSCHYDCLGPPLYCNAGVVHRQGYGPRPCCHSTDFFGVPNVCGDHEALKCPSGLCVADAAPTSGDDPSRLCEPIADAGDAASESSDAHD
jgi:hypothetical protein